MFYGDEVQDTRKLFFVSWQKHQQNKELLPLEKQIVDVITIHPEYQPMLEAKNLVNDKAFYPELGQTNPFLHMGLHLAIRDQVATNRPAGISEIYHQLLSKYADISLVEHLILEHLAECLWQAERSQSMPDDLKYLSSCQKLLDR